MSAPGNDERHLELKVGAMILVALALLIAFVLILGDWSLTAKKELEVYFENPGGLSAGAAVKIAGRKAGTITEMTFLGQSGPRHPVSGAPSLVRVRISVTADVFKSFRSDVRFYVTTKGMLGDPFLEISPGVAAEPFEPSTAVFGVDPPRIDLFMADAYLLVRGLTDLLERNSDNLDMMIGGTARLITSAEKLINAEDNEHVARFDGLVNGVQGLIDETRVLVADGNRLVNDPKIERSLRNLEGISAKLNRDIEPLIKDVKEALEIVDRLGETIGPQEQAKIKSALAKLDTIATRTNKTLVDVDSMITTIRRGEGTVGQLLVDDELYDDLKEFIRDLKRNPWKLIWQD